MKPTFGWILAAMIVAAPASAQTMYRCHDQGKVIYSDRPCLNGEEAKQMMPNGNPTNEYVARLRMKSRIEEQRAMNAQVAAKNEAYRAKKIAECEASATPAACKP